MTHFVQKCYFYDRDVFGAYDPKQLAVIDVAAVEHHRAVFSLKEGIRNYKNGGKDGNIIYYFNCAAGYDTLCTKRVHRMRSQKWL